MTFRFYRHVIISTAVVLSCFFSDVVQAVVPADEPTFNNPLNFTSAYAPFQPGGVKVFSGDRGERRLLVIHSYLFQTRSFTWNGTNVECRILREMNFENNRFSKFTDNYLAQADNGSVYAFGKSVSNVTNGVIENHEGSWLVGGPTPADPAGTLTATEPTLVMLAEPEVGDIFRSKDLPPELSVTARVLTTNLPIVTGVGRFTNVVRVVERIRGQPDTIRAYASEVGALSKKNRREEWRLISSTLMGPELIVSTNNFSAPTNVIDVPMIPEAPTTPETPTIPEFPAVPETPNNPEEPTEEEPVDPEEPTDPVEPPTIPLPPLPN